MSESPAAQRTVAITGASGMIGSALSEALRERGDQVLHLVRRAPRAEGLPAGVTEAEWVPDERRLDPSLLDGVDAVVHLAGAGIGDQRWTKERKREILASRVDGTTAVSEAVAAHGSRVRLVSASGVGYYGDRGADVLTEESSLGQGFLAEVVRDWEAATWHAEQAGAPVAHARSGIVLAPQGGAMARLMPLAKAGLAGPLGSGKQFWAWITLRDEVRALMFLVDRPDITGAVNLAAPTPASQSTVVKALGEELHRPAVLPAPTIALRLALGQMAGEILGSQRALPTVLSEAGFTWEHPDLDAAMEWLVQAQKDAKDGRGKAEKGSEDSHEDVAEVE
jgi:uncharacterized protein